MAIGQGYNEPIREGSMGAQGAIQSLPAMHDGATTRKAAKSGAPRKPMVYLKSRPEYSSRYCWYRYEDIHVP
jgi:hypothetical protein